MSSRRVSKSELEPETLQIAKGLYETKVAIVRPPSAAQRDVYSAGRRRRPFSAKACINSEKTTSNQTAQAGALPPEGKPPWRPFSGHSSLSRQRTNPDRGRDIHHSREAGNVSEIDNGRSPSIPDVYLDRQLPRSLVPLQQWLSESIPQDWCPAYDPKTNFVFLPGMSISNHDNLQTLPPEQDARDELAFTPAPAVQHYKPPKPRLQQFTEKQEPRTPERSAGGTAITKPSQIKIYGKDGELIHDIYQGKRTSEIIRQEIEDLERLLQGIGNPHGSSLVVRYQHDINCLRDMAKYTLDYYGISESEVPRPLTPVAAVLQEDLLKYPARHDEIMASIQERRDECVRELAELERQLMRTT